MNNDIIFGLLVATLVYGGIFFIGLFSCRYLDARKRQKRLQEEVQATLARFNSQRQEEGK